MTAPVYFKDPHAVVDYVVDWTDWLAGDTITGAAVWDVPSGISKSSQSENAQSATIVLSGGTAGVDYAIGCKITTIAGRTEERTLIIRCRDNV